MTVLELPLNPPPPNPFPNDAALQRRKSGVRVWCLPNVHVGDLSSIQSQYIGPLVGNYGWITCSISSSVFKGPLPAGSFIPVFFRSYVIDVPMRIQTVQLRACVFTHVPKIKAVIESFDKAGLSLQPVPNYDSNTFYGVPHFVSSEYIENC